VDGEQVVFIGLHHQMDGGQTLYFLAQEVLLLQIIGNNDVLRE